MEFALGMVAGALLWPWYCLAGLAMLVIVDVIFCENDAYVGGFFTMLLGVSLLGWLGGSWSYNTLWSVIVANLGNLALFSVYYLAIGGAWSIAKWFLYSLKLRDALREEIAEWNKSSDASDTPGVGRSRNPKPSRPSRSFAKNNKGRLTGWVAMWPFSMIGTFIGDFLTKVFDHVVKALSGIYDSISNAVWKEME